MKRFVLMIVFTLSICITPAYAAEPTYPSHFSSYEQYATAIWLTAVNNPTLTYNQVVNLVSEPDFANFAGAEISRSIVISKPATVDAGTTRDALQCWKGKASVKARGIFGTLWSHTVNLTWCEDNKQVYYQSGNTIPDVTTYGATFGWTYDGAHQDTEALYYYWGATKYGTSYYHGGYRRISYGIFGRCLAKVGCIDQRFTQVGVRAYFDGTYKYDQKAW